MAGWMGSSEEEEGLVVGGHISRIILTSQANFGGPNECSRRSQASGDIGWNLTTNRSICTYEKKSCEEGLLGIIAMRATLLLSMRLQPPKRSVIAAIYYCSFGRSVGPRQAWALDGLVGEWVRKTDACLCPAHDKDSNIISMSIIIYWAQLECPRANVSIPFL